MKNHQTQAAFNNQVSQEDSYTVSLVKDYPRQALIFRDVVSKQQVIDFAQEIGWLLVATREPQPREYIPLEIVWVTPEQETAIHYLEDWHIEDGAGYPFSLKTPYFIIEGKNLEDISLSLCSSFALYSPEEILNWVTTAVDSEELITAIVHLGVIAPSKFEQRFFDAVKIALSHRDPFVRTAVVWNCGTLWVECREIIEHLSKNDPHPDVRLESEHQLYAFDYMESEDASLDEVWPLKVLDKIKNIQIPIKDAFEFSAY